MAALLVAAEGLEGAKSILEEAMAKREKKLRQRTKVTRKHANSA